jgi:hypothetical protein
MNGQVYLFHKTPCPNVVQQVIFVDRCPAFLPGNEVSMFEAEEDGAILTD